MPSNSILKVEAAASFLPLLPRLRAEGGSLGSLDAPLGVQVSLTKSILNNQAVAASVLASHHAAREGPFLGPLKPLSGDFHGVAPEILSPSRSEESSDPRKCNYFEFLVVNHKVLNGLMESVEKYIVRL